MWPSSVGVINDIPGVTICQPPGFSCPLKDMQAAWDPDTRRVARCLGARVEVKQAGNQTRGLRRRECRGSWDPVKEGPRGLSIQGHQHSSSVTETKPKGRASETRVRDQERAAVPELSLPAALWAVSAHGAGRSLLGCSCNLQSPFPRYRGPLGLPSGWHSLPLQTHASGCSTLYLVE